MVIIQTFTIKNSFPKSLTEGFVDEPNQGIGRFIFRIQEQGQKILAYDIESNNHLHNMEVYSPPEVSYWKK